jgi:NitT/TauT family transport system permease protein
MNKRKNEEAELIINAFKEKGSKSAEEIRPDALHERFLAGRRSERRKVIAVQIVMLLAFLGVWEAAGRLKWIDVLLFSYPSKIGLLLWNNMADGSLFPHVMVTVLETITGFVLGTVFGTAIAVLIWWSPFLPKCSTHTSSC